MQFRAKIKDGEIRIFRERLFENLLESLEGEDIVLEFRQFEKIRSLNQLNYYWAIMGFLANQTGHTKDELHLLFKRKFLKKIVEVDGQKYEFIPSLSNISMHKLWDYTEDIRYYMNQKGVYIPEPQEMSMISNSRIYKTKKIERS